ncbi:MAG: arsenate reductase ArsC [Phycisphaerae bacterium]
MSSQIKVLFICTGNACRSQMAETLLRHIGGDRFEAFSAGSHPAGFIHPLAVRAMERLGLDMADQYSKSWDEFADKAVDLVITLCDSAAALPCPNWAAGPMVAHWSHPDPVAMPGPDQQRLEFAVEVANRLRQKLERLIALDFDNAPRPELLARIQQMGIIS